MFWWLKIWMVLSMAVVATLEDSPPCMQPYFFYTTGLGIWCAELTNNGDVGATHRVLQFEKHRGYVYSDRPIAVDVKRKKLYWHDFFAKEIHQSNLDGTNLKPIVTGFTGVVRFMTVDWITGYIYWLDQLHGWIGVAKYDKNTGVGYRKTLIYIDHKNVPSGLAIDANEGYLFWTNRETKVIERSRLDGSERKIIKENTRSYDIAIDVNKKRLYWCNTLKFKICYSDYNGIGSCDWSCDRTWMAYGATFYSPGKIFIVSLRSYSSELEKGLDLYDLNTDTRKFYYTDRDVQRFFSLATIADETSQPSGYNPCDMNPQPCRFFCLRVSGNNTRCECPVGMISTNNGCQKLPVEYSIYFADQNVGKLFRVRQFANHKDFGANAIPTHETESSYPVALAYDQKEDMLYWSDSGHKKIYRMKSHGDNVTVIASTNVDKVYGLSIDYIGRLLFWTNEEKGAIEVAQLNGSNRIMINNIDLEKPRDVVVNPEGGRLDEYEFPVQQPFDARVLCRQIPKGEKRKWELLLMRLYQPTTNIVCLPHILAL